MNTTAEDNRLGKVPRVTLTQAIGTRLALAIREGRIAPGERLVEAQLARDLGTSRGPVREALRLLAQSGLIEFRAESGCFVSKPSLSDVAEMVQMRALLEGISARVVAANRSGEVLDRLRATVDDLEAAAHRGDVHAVRELDWRFHEVLCRSAGLAPLLKAWYQMRDTIRLFMSTANPRYGDLAELVESHRRLLEVLGRSEPDFAERKFRAQILEAGYSLLGQAVPELWRGK
jgi:DNA-binding GntR family transcriptional regulator